MSTERWSDEALEELKASVLLGELPLDDPRVAALPDADRRELEELLGLCTALDEEAATEPVSAADEDLARRFLAAQPAKVQDPRSSAAVAEPATGIDRCHSPDPRAIRPGRVVGWLSLAAGLALVAWSYFGREEAPRGGGTGVLELGSPQVSIEALSPVGPSESFAELRWSGERRSGWNWRVVVEFADEQGGARELRSPPLSRNLWEPPQSLPDRIRWRVDLVQFGNARNVVEGEWIEASLRR